jgi:hypothetical protein
MQYIYQIIDWSIINIKLHFTVKTLETSNNHVVQIRPGEAQITTGACAAPGRFYTTGSELHLDVSGQQEPLLLSDVSTLKGPELHLDVTRLQEPVLPWTCPPYKGLCWPVGIHVCTTCLSCTYGLPWQQEPFLLLDVPTLQWPGQHLDLSTPQWPVLTSPGLLHVRNCENGQRGTVCIKKTIEKSSNFLTQANNY